MKLLVIAQYKFADEFTEAEDVARGYAGLQGDCMTNYEIAVDLWQKKNIHPFADGNGRTGRLLMNYFLVINNHPPIIIFEEDRKLYFDALEAWDNEQELKPLVEFLRYQTEKTWAKQIQRRTKKIV
ncbi:MAG: Fic family protein [Phascolarctobacterium sp.]|nr:Fic family protein [Phascolarctobacterium sp.]